MCRFGALAREGGSGPVAACAFLARLPVSGAGGFGELAFEVEASPFAGVGVSLGLDGGSPLSSLASLCCKFWICWTRSARSELCGSGIEAGRSGRTRQRAIRSVKRASVLVRVQQCTYHQSQRNQSSLSLFNLRSLSSTSS